MIMLYHKCLIYFHLFQFRCYLVLTLVIWSSVSQVIFSLNQVKAYDMLLKIIVKIIAVIDFYYIVIKRFLFSYYLFQKCL